MKTILVIENDAIEFKKLVVLFRELKKKTNLFQAEDTSAAAQILSDTQVDLLLCRISKEYNERLNAFSRLTHKGSTRMPAIEINTEIELRCLLPGIKEEQKIDGRVKNSQISDRDTQVGIEFISLQPHVSETIDTYVYSREYFQSPLSPDFS
jgi:hypothetical protein